MAPSQPARTGLGTRLRQLVGHLDRAVDQAYTDLGLDYRAAFTPVTRALIAAESLSVKQIAAAAGGTHSAASQTVAQMRKAGLVEDAPGADGRERRVRLSDLARRQLPVIEAQWARTDAAAAALSAELGVDLDATLAAALDIVRDRPFLDHGDPERPPARWLGPAEQGRALAGLADLIERHYVFPEDAAAYAEEVRRWPLADDGIATGAFAEALTTALRRHDRHFKVTWGRPPTPSPEPDRAEPRSHLAFHREGRVGVVTASLFADGDDPAAAAEARSCLERLNACAAAVFDLRRTPGGWPSMVELLSGPFLGPEPAPILTFTSRAAPDHPSVSRPAPEFAALADMPLYVLVGERTASAAESFAYALQTTGRATIVGATTAGAANPGESFPDPSGFWVFVSTGAPIDPRTGTNWEGAGVRPDVAADPGAALEAALRLAAA
jgi:DNA-binding MarR family transcriptional regulator